jgi:SAM-dependent methyltransferase
MNCPFCNGEMQPNVCKDLSRCKECGLYGKQKFPSKSSLLKKQKNFLLGACRNKNKLEERMKTAHGQVDLLEKLLPKDLSKSLYDVGAASGFFMKAAHDRGWDVLGNDLSIASINYAKKHFNLTIECGFLEDLWKEDDKLYSSIVLWNSLEHTLDPAKVLRMCHSKLHEGGLVLIEVPIKSTGEIDRLYEGPHLWEFNRDCIMGFMYDLGFECKINLKEYVDHAGVNVAIWLFQKRKPYQEIFQC